MTKRLSGFGFYSKGDVMFKSEWAFPKDVAHYCLQARKKSTQKYVDRYFWP